MADYTPQDWDTGDSFTADDATAMSTEIEELEDTSFPVFNVKLAYGAAGDGAADDTTEFAAAIAAAVAAGGGTVYAPAGTYILNRLALASNVTLAGAGMGVTVLKLNPSAADGAWVVRVNASGDDVSSNTHLRDLTIDGNKAAWGAGDTKKFYGYYLGTNTAGNVTNCTVTSVEFKNCKTYAMDLVKATHVTIRDCFSHDNGYTTGTLNNCSGFELLGDDVKAVGCYSWNNANKGFITGESGVVHYRTQFINCTAYDNTNEGFYFHDDVTQSFAQGGASYNNSRGVAFHTSSIYCGVSGMMIRDNDGNGIRVDGASYITIENNILDANATASSGNQELYLNNGSNCVVVGNIINSSTSNTSIVEAGTSNFNRFSGNIYNKTFTIIGAKSRDTDADSAYDFLPRDHGLLAWTYDPIHAATGTVLPVGGTAYTALVKVPSRMTVTNIVNYLSTAPGTLTNAFVALYDGTTLLSQSANLTATWATTGLKTNALAAPQTLNPGTYRIIMWATVSAGALPAFLRQGGQPSNNANLTGTAIRYGTADTSLTTTAPSTLGTITAVSTGAWWFGLS